MAFVAASASSTDSAQSYPTFMPLDGITVEDRGRDIKDDGDAKEIAVNVDFNELNGILGGGGVVLDRQVLESYAGDYADLVERIVPSCVVRPSTTKQVQDVVRWARNQRVPIVPRGAGSGLSGGANALEGSLVMSLERLTAIRDLSVEDQYVVVEAGVVNADVSREVARHGLFYPPDPGSYEISTIGGNVATNAGGMRCLKYGVTRASVLGLEVVLADGRLLRTGGITIKDVAGFDLTQMFIGSEGALGIITAATLRLQPLPASNAATFVATFPNLDEAGAALAAIFRSGSKPSMLELMDRNTVRAVCDYKPIDLDRDAAATLLGQFDDADALASAEALVATCETYGSDFAFATDVATEADMFLAARRLAGYATMEAGPSVIEDVCVPRSKLLVMLKEIDAISEATGVHIATVGHAGDGNLHPVLMLRDLGEDSQKAAWAAADGICAAAIALGGTITGEHGVGVLKKRWIADQINEVGLDVHAQIKHALDPLNLLNPGKGF